MEELLNKLIEKGWKPFDVDVKIKRAKCFHSVHFIVRWLVNFVLDGYAEATVPLRELVSKESWLWQFVCDREHRFIDKKNYDRVSLDKRLKNPYVDYDGVNTEYERITVLEYEYRLIESALCDEDKLEQFLLENIKVE